MLQKIKVILRVHLLVHHWNKLYILTYEWLKQCSLQENSWKNKNTSKNKKQENRKRQKGSVSTKSAFTCLHQNISVWFRLWKIFHHTKWEESKCHNLTASIYQVKYCFWIFALFLVRRPLVLTNTPDLHLPACMSGTVLWISPSSVGHRSGLGYRLGCTILWPPLRFC